LTVALTSAAPMPGTLEQGSGEEPANNVLYQRVGQRPPFWL